MPPRKQTHSHNKASARPRSGQAAARSLRAPARQPTDLAALLQRATADPGWLTSPDVIQLQRTVGNRAASRLLSQTAQPQPGPESDHKTGLPDSLKTGDIVVQRGTIHTWVNRGSVPAVTAFILIDAKPAEVNGEMLRTSFPAST